eukprot:scaffold24762_cov107-Isochrysis_galbana.AAC.4
MASASNKQLPAAAVGLPADTQSSCIGCGRYFAARGLRQSALVAQCALPRRLQRTGQVSAQRARAEQRSVFLKIRVHGLAGDMAGLRYDYDYFASEASISRLKPEAARCELASQGSRVPAATNTSLGAAWLQSGGPRDHRLFERPVQRPAQDGPRICCVG